MKIKLHQSIKFRLFSNYSVLIVLMIIIGLFSWSTSMYYQEQVDNMFERNLLLTNVSVGIKSVDEELLKYLSTKNSDNLNNYMQHVMNLEELSEELSTQVQYYTEEELMIIDIVEMVSYLVDVAEYSVEYKRKSDVTGYTKYYNEFNLVRGYIEGYIDDLNARQLNRNATRYNEMTQQVKRVNTYNIILIIDLILLSFIIVLKTTRRIINPIVKLSHTAEVMAEGQYDIEDITVDNHDELEVLAVAFNRMKLSVQSHFDDIKEKAETEAKLMDQELENLKMQSLLDQSYMNALQSQMNPHFLFNTINAAVQLSKIESASRTNMFLESMSRLFRYNVKELDTEVTLDQEIENIRDYLELLRVRFGDMITFEIDADQSALGLKMPPLILQPIIENAYMHGLSKKMDKGHLLIKVVDRLIDVEIVIQDDGVGIEAETLELIRQNNSVKTDSTGIGFKNVKRRLELYYKSTNLISIESQKNVYTTVRLNLPYEREVLDD